MLCCAAARHRAKQKNNIGSGKSNSVAERNNNDIGKSE